MNDLMMVSRTHGPEGTRAVAQLPAESRVREAIEALPWRTALPADGMPAHQYVILGKCPTEAWDVLAKVVREHPESYDAYFRGYPWPMHYWEFEGYRFWRTSGKGSTYMLNRCTLDSVEPPRRVDEGATPAQAWTGLPWALDGTPYPPGYVPGPGPAHYRGMRYDPVQDPRRGFPCTACGIDYWLYEPTRSCPRRGAQPSADEVQRRGL
jgi:hypothetical protein